MDNRTPSGPQKPDNNYLRYSNFAFQLLGGISLGGWIGYRLDKYLNLTFPVFLLLFVMLVLGAMIFQMYKQLNENK
ncbi:MAG TPA: AtpZ/AtpI family protein [Cyclobacteriaceae bacterium]|nr:AtpZ/AtpI family protein [Cyclobacteriaceae bacterium]